jgi:hypothetical protein
MCGLPLVEVPELALQESIDTVSRGARRWWWNLFVLTPWVLGAMLLISDWWGDRSIAERQQTAPGTIVAHEPNNHDRYGYSFIIAGKSHAGWHVPTGNEQPTIGQSVTVYYDPRDPDTNALVDFGERARRSLGPVPFLIGGSGLIALVILIRRRSTASTD